MLPKIRIGFYSPSKIVCRLIQEQFQEEFDFVFFAQEVAFVQNCFQKNCDAYLEDRASGFSLQACGQGVPEVIPKPFSLKSLLGKIQQFKKERHFKIGAYFFDEKQRLLQKNDTTQIQLREKEADFLLFLLQSPHQKADRQTLLHHVWGYPAGAQTHTLETHVYHLRKKIEEDPENPQILIFEGDGYRLIF